MTGWQYDPPQADLYQVLGVGRDASREEIARAYRQRARSAHPDTHPADPQAAARFRALTSAYDVLSDAVRRGDYDRQQAGQVPPDLPPAWPAPPGRPPVSPDHPPVSPAGPPLRAGPVRVQPAPGDPLLWAGPVRVQPPGAAASPGPGDPGEAGDLDALAMLARLLLSRYAARDWAWPGGDPDWPGDDWGWPW